MTDRVCATPGCHNPVAVRRGTTGRPPIYCSRACRLAWRVTRRQTDPVTTQPTEITIANDSGDEITVEISQDPEDPSPMRSWTVTIHRGQQAVTVGHGLGRFAAAALTGDLQQLFNHTNQQGGHIID